MRAQKVFKKGSYRSKPWLLGVADKVQRSANNYRVQFTECKDELKNPFIFYLIRFSPVGISLNGTFLSNLTS